MTGSVFCFANKRGSHPLFASSLNFKSPLPFYNGLHPVEGFPLDNHCLFLVFAGQKSLKNRYHDRDHSGPQIYFIGSKDFIEIFSWPLFFNEPDPHLIHQVSNTCPCRLQRDVPWRGPA